MGPGLVDSGLTHAIDSGLGHGLALLHYRMLADKSAQMQAYREQQLGLREQGLNNAQEYHHARLGQIESELGLRGAAQDLRDQQFQMKQDASDREGSGLDLAGAAFGGGDPGTGNLSALASQHDDTSGWGGPPMLLPQAGAADAAIAPGGQPNAGPSGLPPFNKSWNKATKQQWLSAHMEASRSHQVEIDRFNARMDRINQLPGPDGPGTAKEQLRNTLLSGLSEGAHDEMSLRYDPESFRRELDTAGVAPDIQDRAIQFARATGKRPTPEMMDHWSGPMASQVQAGGAALRAVHPGATVAATDGAAEARLRGLPVELGHANLSGADQQQHIRGSGPWLDLTDAIDMAKLELNSFQQTNGMALMAAGANRNSADPSKKKDAEDLLSEHQGLLQKVRDAYQARQALSQSLPSAPNMQRPASPAPAAPVAPMAAPAGPGASLQPGPAAPAAATAAGDPRERALAVFQAKHQRVPNPDDPGDLAEFNGMLAGGPAAP